MDFYGFNMRDQVEVIRHDPGLVGAHIDATIVGLEARPNFYLVSYRHIRENDSGRPLGELVPALNIRPQQPYHQQAVFLYGEHIDVWWRRSWWYGTIERNRGEGLYDVEFSNFGYPTMTVNIGRIRAHYHWANGEWSVVTNYND